MGHCPILSICLSSRLLGFGWEEIIIGGAGIAGACWSIMCIIWRRK